MRKSSAATITVLALLAALESAQAADMPPIIQQAAAPVIEEFGSGWYLRGDIGYRFHRKLDAVLSNGAAILASDFEDTFIVGAGAGFKANWFRADITADYAAPARYTAISFPYISTKIDAVTILVNGYVDLGTWHGITPYVGAGAGAALTRTSSFTAFPPGTVAHVVKDTNFAWALMAGIGYNLTPNVTIDAGYRYVHLGGARGGDALTTTAATFDSIKAHEARLGVRYLID